MPSTTFKLAVKYYRVLRTIRTAILKYEAERRNADCPEDDHYLMGNAMAEIRSAIHELTPLKMPQNVR